MKKIVVKFGGSNLKEAGSIDRLANVIRMYNRPLVVVVSAFYGITDRLSEMLKKVKDDRNLIHACTKFLAEMKNDIIDQNINNRSLRNNITKEIALRIKELEKVLLGIHYLGDTPKFTEDIVLSFGERLSSLIVSEILKFKGIDCKELLPEDIGLITDGEFGNATVDFRRSKKTVKQKLEADHIFIIPGFYGLSTDGKITIFGRGGSDYSAAAIAHCIDAESLDVWKDVDGFQNADPKLINGVVTIPRLNYGEAAELAYFGAKILHPRTVEPLIEKNIPVRILNINKVGKKIEPHTLIDSKVNISKQVVKSVTCSDDFCSLQYSGPGVGIKPGLMARITQKLDESKINIKLIFNSHTRINLFLSNEDVERAYKVLKGLKLSGVNKINIKNNMSTIAVVGCGMTEKPGIAARLFSSVAEAGINIKTISSGASDYCTYFIVDKINRDKAIKAIHKEFFN